MGASRVFGNVRGTPLSRGAYIIRMPDCSLLNVKVHMFGPSALISSLALLAFSCTFQGKELGMIEGELHMYTHIRYFSF